MLLIPAIDLKDGQCVRLKQGDMDQSTVFSEDPAAMAKSWLDKGARRLHLVDLNGAFAGKPAAVVSSSMGPISGFGANHHLRQSLAFLDMPTLQQPEVYLGGVNDGWFGADGRLTKDDTRAFIGKFAQTFAEWIERTAPRA